MNTRLSPSDVYPDNKLLAEYVAGRPETLSLFGHAPGNYHVGSDRRMDPDLVNRLRAYNESLGCSDETLRNLDALSHPETRCVIGGHQAIFLGGPAFTTYKILTVVRLARRLTTMSDIPIVPVFWLASEDHDFGEIHRLRFLERDGALRTINFGWPEQGRPIEALPITEAVRAALEESTRLLGERPRGADLASLLQPEPGDDYATWHARIWSRLFDEAGLIVVEPRILRPFSGRFLHETLRRDAEVRDALRRGATDVQAAGYPPALDPHRVGCPFVFDAQGKRQRIDDAGAHVDTVLDRPEAYSTDAALRPLLADRLLPTIASVLGPGELAYQAMLKPLYQLLDVPQPVLVPRQGYTVLDPSEARLLEQIGVDPGDVIRGTFDASRAMAGAASKDVSDAFDRARESVEEALRPLRPVLGGLDSDLNARWEQTLRHAQQGIAKLEDRARRADLARSGISAAGVRRLESTLRPAGKLQERVLSFVHFASLYGVEWLHELPGADEAGTFAHYVATTTGGR